MSGRLHRFRHGGVHGAVIEVLKPAKWDLASMLPEDIELPLPSTVTYTYACHYLNVKDQHVMVDAGTHAAKVQAALSTLNVASGDLDWILITHGDGDHVAGLLDEKGGLAYPNALHVLHRELWEHWQDDEALSTYSEDTHTFIARLAERLEGHVRILETECSLTNDIRFLPALGHRHGHSAYELATSGSPILHFGDALFHPLYAANPDWPDALALNPENEVKSRRYLLNRAAETRALILTGHIPFPGIGTISKEGDGYRWTDID